MKINFRNGGHQNIELYSRVAALGKMKTNSLKSIVGNFYINGGCALIGDCGTLVSVSLFFASSS